jgi:hypothetical protein
MNPLLKGFTGAVRPRENLKTWEWCEKHVKVDHTSSIGGGRLWRSDSSPWVIELMELFADNRIETIVIRCATQSSKTQTLILLLCWIISEDPAPTLWVANAKDDLKQTIRDRIGPTFEMCKPVAEQLQSAGQMEFEFATMTLYFAGGGSKGKVKSKPIRWLILDEVEEIPPANVYQALERTKAQWNKRRVLISTGNLSTGLMQQFFDKGDQRTAHWICPACTEVNPLKFIQLKWDTNDMTKPNGKYNFDKLAETVRWVCPKCGHAIPDLPYERRQFAKAVRFKRLNEAAPAHTVSITWPSFMAPWVKWRDLAEKFLNARAALRKGDIEPMKSFINDDCGESWEDMLGIIEDFGFLEARRRDYGFNEPWAEGRRRYMAADKQEKHGGYYPWVVREAAPFGKTRLIAYGEARTYAELEALRVEYRVLREDAIIDSGFDTQDVYRFCLSFGWKAFKGDQVPFYLVNVPDPKHAGRYRTIRQIWRRTQAVVYNIKTHAKVATIPLFTFAADAALDGLAECMNGIVGEWTISKDTGRDYMKQIGAKRRVEKLDTRGNPVFVWERIFRDDHYLDCEVEIYVGQIISKTINAPVIEAKTKPAPVDVGSQMNGERQPYVVTPGAGAVGTESEPDGYNGAPARHRGFHSTRGLSGGQVFGECQ